MEEMGLLSSLLGNIDLSYIIICNTLAYIIIQGIETTFPKLELTTLYKRLISAVSAICIGYVMVTRYEHDSETIFYCFFLQFLTWDYVFKNWLAKLGEMFNANEDVKLKRQSEKSYEPAVELDA